MVGQFLRGVLVVAALLIFAAIGLLVFFSDPDVRDVEAREKYGNPPSQFITLPSGATVHYRDQGQRNGPAIVLVHGAQGSLHEWEPWVAQLGDQFRMISLDLPGHGLTGPVPSEDYSSEATMEFVSEFTGVMNIERFVLAGHSMGGAIAARMAIRHPERLTALILVNAAGLPTSAPRQQSLGYFVLRTPILQNILLYVSPRTLFEAEYKKRVANQQIVTPEMIDRYWILNRKTGNRAATLKRFQTPSDTFVQDNVSKIATPTLILWGDQDGSTPPDIGQAYNAAIKGSRLVVFRNTGHLTMEETPEQSARIVRDFLAERLSGSPPSR